MRDSRLGFAKLCLALLVFGVASWGQNNNRTEFVNGREAAEREVLVKFRSGAINPLPQLVRDEDVDETQGVGNAGVVRIRSRSRGVAALLQNLRRNPDVELVEPNYILYATAEPNDTYFSLLWGLKNTGQNIGGQTGASGADIGAAGAWDISTGSTANVVGVVDTGVNYNHPDLAANVWTAPSSFSVIVGGTLINCAKGTHGFNAIKKTCDPLDDNNHGTHVSGTIGARGNNGTGVAGVNWTASVLGLKFLGASGSGSTSDAINAIEFAVQLKLRGLANVRVLNNSWGGGGFSQALLDEIERANTYDMLFVAAAGNNESDNDATASYPSNYDAPNVVAVAATDNLDALASFSSYGETTVDLGAPGVYIASTIRSGYAYMSGTSMATPHVSGAAALVLSHCALDTAHLKANLLDNVDVIPSLTGKTVTNGRLNVNKAIRACSTQPTDDFSLSASPDSQTVTAGGATSYTTTVTALNGFAGTVTFSVTGLPDGAGAIFSPTSVTDSGSSSMSVTTGTSTPAGTYTLTITGTSGSLSHSTTVMLVVNAPNFTISAAPSSRKVTRGAQTTYTVTIAALNGFTGAVALNVTGVPSGSNGAFSPTSVTGSGSSTLTVSTSKNSPKGTFTLTITGTSGSLVHSTTVKLTLR